ncbi:hypothetical protein MMC30_002765 [Trapelia coarctata]|nr:hypothetical protein [Trapelia coarctata]
MEGLAEVRRFKIDDDCMGWLLKKPGGKIMFVLPRTGGSLAGRDGLPAVRYRAWLGEYLGFTEEFVAKTFLPETPIAKYEPVQSLSLVRKSENLVVSADSDTSKHTFDPRTCGKRRLTQGNRSEAEGSRKRARIAVAEDLPHGILTLSFKFKVSTKYRAAPSESPGVSHMSSPLHQGTTTEMVQSSLFAPQHSAASASEIDFHFFLSDLSLGAIHKPASACSTADLFFEAAATSFKTTYPEGQEPVIAAVGVSWNGARWPRVVCWMDADGFRSMMSTLEGIVAARTSSREEFEVEVPCILQR